jgi:PAS domain S-box-containing protein
LTLVVYVLAFNVTLDLALTASVRGVINGFLTGMIVELAMVIYEAVRRQLHREDRTVRLGLNAVLALTLLIVIAAPMLYIVAGRLHGMRTLDQVAVLLLALFCALALSQGLARVMTHPVVELERTAAALAAGNPPPVLRAFLPITTEYASLLRSVRLMSERIESSWNRQQDLQQEVAITKGELDATFDAMTDAVVITDVDDRVLRANVAYCRLRGVEPDNAVGRVLSEIAHTNGEAAVCEVCRARREGRTTIVLRKPQDTPIGRYLEIRVDPILNAAGERMGSVQVLRDLTDKHRVEAEAERASSLLKNLVDAAYDAVYATDLSGQFLWANKRAAELLGFAGNSFEGASSLQFIHPDDQGSVRSNFSRAASGEAHRYEMRYLAADGSVRLALMSNSPIYAEGEIVAVLAVMRDVTEERMVTEQTMRSDKLRALGQLASGVAHNFNNALTAVLGYTQMVQIEVEDTRLKKYLNTVEKAALDAAKMVQRIQNFARQRQDEQATAADINQIVRDALDLTVSRWRDDARAAGFEYDIIFRPTDDVVVTCDQSAIREVFVNIIINALDAMPGGGRLTISASQEAGRVVVAFADSGDGMTDEVRQRIFEPFYTTKGVKGYGMGLAVSFGIIERHGGEIQVKSEPGRGSTFILRFPLFPPSLEEILPDEAPGARVASVLVVDDELPIRTLLADLLRARGHKVLTAEDGLAGLRAIEASRFDLVITDLSMPGADGWTLVSEVRRRWPGTKLMMVTGYGGFAEVAVTGGDTSLIDMLISKPFNIGEIDARINELLLKDTSLRML